MGLITSAVIGAVGAVGSAAIQKSASDKAVSGAKQARNQQYRFLREGRSLVGGYTQPYRDAGENAIGAMQGMLGLGGETYDLQTDPGYQFRFGEGVRAMDASASARGGLLSGGALKDLTTFGQDSASQEYMNIFTRLQALAGGGLQATGMMSNAAMGTGTGLAQAAGDFGNTAASGAVAQGNIGAGLLGDLASIGGNLATGLSKPSQTTTSGYQYSTGPPEARSAPQGAGVGGRSIFG